MLLCQMNILNSNTYVMKVKIHDDFTREHYHRRNPAITMKNQNF